MTAFEAKTLAKRAQFEQIADEAGWAIEKRLETTDFRRAGWHMRVSWIDGCLYPATLVVFDPRGDEARSMNFHKDRWTIGGELWQQLKSPGPLRDKPKSLADHVAGLLSVMEMRGTRPVPADFVAEKLRDMLEETP